MEWIIALVWVGLSLGLAWQEGRHRKLGFVGTLAASLLISPLLGYFIMLLFPLKAPRGCRWCGNASNEVEYCGLCGKNDAGDLRPV